jgi:hypothetical protein
MQRHEQVFTSVPISHGANSMSGGLGGGMRQIYSTTNANNQALPNLNINNANIQNINLNINMPKATGSNLLAQ